jgi:hypothetical protein
MRMGSLVSWLIMRFCPSGLIVSCRLRRVSGRKDYPPLGSVYTSALFSSIQLIMAERAAEYCTLCTIEIICGESRGTMLYSSSMPRASENRTCCRGGPNGPVDVFGRRQNNPGSMLVRCFCDVRQPSINQEVAERLVERPSIWPSSCCV